MMRHGIVPAGIAEQEELLARMERISRGRALSPRETDVLAELIRRAQLRNWWRQRRQVERRERLLTQLARLGGVVAA